MDSFPWEDGDPPDHQLCRKGEEEDEVRVQGLSVVVAAVGISVVMMSAIWGGEGDVGVVSSSQFGWFGGHCCEIPGREGDARGDDHGMILGFNQVSSHKELQLDLGLTDITKYSTYSKLWRMLYFVNDAPFRIHNHRSVTGDRTVSDITDWSNPWHPWAVASTRIWKNLVARSCDDSFFQGLAFSVQPRFTTFMVPNAIQNSSTSPSTRTQCSADSKIVSHKCSTHSTSSKLQVSIRTSSVIRYCSMRLLLVLHSKTLPPASRSLESG